MSIRPFAEAFEARFRQIEGALSIDPPPEGVRRMVWDRTLGLRNRFPALQDALATASSLPQTALGRSDVVSMRENRVALPTGEPDPLPEGHEPLGGARFAGYAEQSLGGSMPVLFHRWCVEQARQVTPVAYARGGGEAAAPNRSVPDVSATAEAIFADPDAQVGFCHDLVDKALGIGRGSVGHPDAADGFIWHPATVVFGPEHLEAFAEGAARAMFAAAWSRTTSENLSGLDVLEAAPATPADALLEGYRLAGRCEAANGMSIDDLVEAARMADCGGDQDVYEARSHVMGGLAEGEEFGRSYALSACGNGTSWFDRHADFDLRPVRFEYDGPDMVAEEPQASLPSPRF
jgi:hypothetical protein